MGIFRFVSSFINAGEAQENRDLLEVILSNGRADGLRTAELKIGRSTDFLSVRVTEKGVSDGYLLEIDALEGESQTGLGNVKYAFHFDVDGNFQSGSRVYQGTSPEEELSPRKAATTYKKFYDRLEKQLNLGANYYRQ